MESVYLDSRQGFLGSKSLRVKSVEDTKHLPLLRTEVAAETTVPACVVRLGNESHHLNRMAISVDS